MLSDDDLISEQLALQQLVYERHREQVIAEAQKKAEESGD